MLSKKQMTITDITIEKFRKNYESAKVSSDYENGRLQVWIIEAFK